MWELAPYLLLQGYGEDVIRVLALYPRDGCTRFDHDYWVTKHLELVKGAMGGALKSVEFAKGIDDPDGNPPVYIATASMLFETREAYLESRAASRPAVLEDVPKFTDYRPITQISDIRVSADLRA